MTALLLAEPEASVRGFLSRQLASDGFDVLAFADAEDLPRAAAPDVLVLGDPGALESCRVHDCPVIVLGRAGPMERVEALASCDDYLTRPFAYEELVARIHAVLRRRPTLEAPGAPALEAQTVTFGPFEFDLALRRLSKDGEQIALTTGEFSMLKALVRHPRQPLSRDKLAQLARGREFEPFDRSLDVQISRLRKMIEPDPSQPRYIQTVWGVGYVFVPDGAA
jgi:two-component system phosphate regulon response regulator OmpR